MNNNNISSVGSSPVKINNNNDDKSDKLSSISKDTNSGIFARRNFWRNKIDRIKVSLGRCSQCLCLCCDNVNEHVLSAATTQIRNSLRNSSAGSEQHHQPETPIIHVIDAAPESYVALLFYCLVCVGPIEVKSDNNIVSILGNS